MAVDYNSPLIRKHWVVEGMLNDAHKSFWAPYTGSDSSNIIYQNNDIMCGLNQLVTFDFDGKLTGAGTEGMDEVCTIGEEDRKFSDSLNMRVFNWQTKGQLKTDACDINDLDLYYHKSSRGKLLDLYLRHKDQFIFDTLVGALHSSCAPTHIFNLGCGFEFQDISELATAAREGIGFYKPAANGVVSDVYADDRYPLEGFRTNDGKPVYLMVITSKMATSLKNNPKYQTIMLHGDVRGAGNALFTGVIGEHEDIVFVTAPVFAGVTRNRGKFNAITDSNITFSGLRRFAVGQDGLQIWQGQKLFRVIERAAEAEKLAIAQAQTSIPALEAALSAAQASVDYTISAQAQADLDALEAELAIAVAAGDTVEITRLNDLILIAQTTLAEALAAELAVTQPHQDALDAAIVAANATRHNKVYSRGLLLGQSAAKLAYGTAPEYQTEPTKFKRSYESILDVFMNVEKTNLTLEMGEDFEGAPITEMDYGVIAVDMEE